MKKPSKWCTGYCPLSSRQEEERRFLQAGGGREVIMPCKPSQKAMWLLSQRVPRAKINGANSEDTEFWVSQNQKQLG